MENDLLYKIALPRGKQEKRLRPTVFQLCIPKMFRHKLLTQFHDILGHFSYQRLMPTISVRYYWKNLPNDIKEFVRTCVTCQFSKVPTNRPTSRLYPLQVPVRPFRMWAMDYKSLVRQTNEGNKHILVFVCHFSGYVILVPTPDETALTTAKVFFREIVARFSLPEIIFSDRGMSFMSRLFGHVTKMMGIKHKTGAALNPRANGYAEQVIKRINEGLRRYSTPDIDDRKIELILPLIQLSLLSTSSVVTKISPFEVVHGFAMPLPDPIEGDQMVFPTADANVYYSWLRNALKLLHAAVHQNRVEAKQDMKAAYDRRHAVKAPTYRIGDVVLLLDKRVKPNSDRVLTHKPYRDVYIISDIISGDDKIGPSYRLVRQRDGQPVKNLINPDKIKLYNENRDSFDIVNPPLSVTGAVKSQNSEVETRNDENKLAQYEPAIKVIRQRQSKGKTQYLVLFRDGTQSWCSDISPALYEYFILRRETDRSKKRRRRKR